jgi:predicted DNA-binding ribbon-helix-helix protein
MPTFSRQIAIRGHMTAYRLAAAFGSAVLVKQETYI